MKKNLNCTIVASVTIDALLFYGVTKFELVAKGSVNANINSRVDINNSDYGYIYYLTNDKIDQAIQEGKIGNYTGGIFNK
jgi:hypothetical protein